MNRNTSSAVATSSLDNDLDRSALSHLASEVRSSRDRSVEWMLERIADDGEPAGATERNGWARVPWALAVSGETTAAASVLAWAERVALGTDGDFREGPARGDGKYRAYQLAHLAIGAWLLERYDTALALMGALRRLGHPTTGGTNTGIVGTEGEYQDLLLTAQTGIAALVTGQEDLIQNTHEWITQLWHDQRELPQRLYGMRAGSQLIIHPISQLTWSAITDFTKQRQVYFNPGIAAVFLAGFAIRRGDTTARDLGREFLKLNINGTSAQFDDVGSVQICKFGWGAAAMLMADPAGDHLRHVARMGRWFISRQASDGSWSPSTFLTAAPTDVDKFLKTAEHAMEVNAILAALGTASGRMAG